MSRRIGERYVGAAIDHSPRPCVAPMIVPPSEVSDRSFVEAFGSPVPNRDHEVAAPLPAEAVNTPMSAARTSSLPRPTGAHERGTAVPGA